MFQELKCLRCGELFNPSRRGHLHCSETCRKLRHKDKNKIKTDQKRAKRLSEKLRILANHRFGKYLIAQAKRAETVEIFQGHNTDSLKELAALRRRCTSASGYLKGELLGTYELSHIWPVLSKNRLGLLHPENLVIAPRDFNRKHGRKEPTEGYLGKSGYWEALEPAFAVTPNEAGLSVLKKIRHYIGQDFDTWLSSFVLTQTQRQLIIKSLVKAGLNKLVLEAMSLRQLKDCAAELEVAFFSIDLEPETPLTIVCEELQRLKIFVGLTDAILLLDRIENSFEGSNYKFIGNDLEKIEFVDALVQDALACIHGQPYEGTFKGQPYQGWFEEIKWGAPEVPEITNQSEDELDDIL